ncbi:MAG: TIGR03826 family flagellar region protein [Lutispora sp.]
MAEIRNCPRCGKIFAYSYSAICNKCMEAEEEEFKLVKEYIYDNSGASISEVSDATGVSADKIMRFLREERLEIDSDVSNMILECESCGRPVRTGRYCEECKNSITNEMRREFGISQRRRETIKTTGKEKMHVIKKREGN